MPGKKRGAGAAGQQQLLSKYFAAPPPRKAARAESADSSPAAVHLVSSDSEPGDDGPVLPVAAPRRVAEPPAEGAAAPGKLASPAGDKGQPERKVVVDPAKAEALVAALEAADLDADAWQQQQQDDEEAGEQPFDGKLTPLEQQWQELKREHPDVVLCVECGYKYRLFGDDAATAGKVLNIVAYRKRAFLEASFPVHRLNVHVRRLVEAGHLVGVVTQAETAALKKVSSTKSKLFKRELSRLYSRATFLADDPPMRHQADEAAPRRAAGRGGARWFVKAKRKDREDEEAGEDEDEDAEEPEAPKDGEEEHAAEAPLERERLREAAERFIVALWELDESGKQAVVESCGGWGLGEPLPSAQGVRIGLVAVDPHSGAFFCDHFVDDVSRSHLALRLSHFAPVEVLALGPTMSLETESCLKRECAGERPPRVERMRYQDWQPDNCAQVLTALFSKQGAHLLSPALALPAEGLAALATMAEYLQRFDLHATLTRSPALESCRKLFDASEASGVLVLEANALSDLEILPRAPWPEHSLVAFLTRHTRTAMGLRILKDWTLHPLTQAARIQARQAAVREILEKGLRAPSKLAPLGAMLKRLRQVDLERAAERIIHGRCGPAGLFQILDELAYAAKALAEAQPSSALLCSTLQQPAGGSLAAGIAALQRGLSRPEAEAGSLKGLFLDAERYPEVHAVRGEITAVEAGLQTELEEVRRVLKRPKTAYRTLRQSASSSLEYLIELPRAHAVPRDWNEVSSTKSLARYRTPRVEALLEELERRREELVSVAAAAWGQLLRDFAREHGAAMRELARAVATVDALAALAGVASLPGYCCPKVTEEGGAAFLHATQARHPLIEGDAAGQVCVANDIALGVGPEGTAPPVGAARVQLVTGPNMGGKSTLVRTCAVCVVLAQMGSFVPAEQCTVGVFDAIRVRMGVRDDPLNAMSTFLVEMRQTAALLQASTPRTLCIADEVGRGTSSLDGLAIAEATLRHLCATLKCPCLFITHYTSLADLRSAFPAETLSALHMSFVQEDETDPTSPLVFLFKAVRGAASSSYGMNVARLAGLPEAVLKAAAAYSAAQAS